MKKLLLLVWPAILFAQLAFGQTVSISGIVKTSQGDLLHLAFVQDKESKQGVYTDSLGSFMLAVKPGSTLHVTCIGYRDTLFKVKGSISLTIILSPAVTITANNNGNGDPGAVELSRQQMSDRIMFNTPVSGTTNSIPNAKGPAGGSAFYDKIAASMGTTPPQSATNNAITQGDQIAVFSEKGETQGSRLFFKDWAHGYVVNSADSLIQSPGFWLNYDKIGGNLLLTKDRVSAIAIYADKVQSFTLFDGMSQPYTFTIVPAIDKTHYAQVIADGNNYKIYKLVRTQFIKANYVSDGVASSGNNYDEYHDDYNYYLLNVKTSQVQQIGLKKKALKQAFAADGTRAEGFFKTNDGDIDDNYLAALGDYMNK